MSDAGAPGIETAAREYAAQDYAAAMRTCLAILRHEPRHFDALHLLGVLCLNAGQRADAVSYLRRAEAEWPEHAQLLVHLGNALLSLRMFEAAEAAFRRSLALRPDDFDALNNLGNTLAGSEQHDAAVACFRQALAVRPDAAPPLYNLGRSLLALDRLEEATESLRAALQSAGPETEPARLLDLHSSLCEALIQQCRHDEALAVCREAPTAIADTPVMQWNEALTLLMLGDYAAGWRKYDSRFRVPEHDPPRDGAAVLDLTAVAGKRVLVFPEQGRGDMIQFARYLPLLAARGAHVLVETYAELKPLFAMIDGVECVVTPDDDVPQHDLLTPLMSLPLAFGTELPTVPAEIPYLRVPKDRLAHWSGRLGRRRRPRIGAAWWGAQHIAKRSMPIATLLPLLRTYGVQFHALQKEIPQAEQDWLAAQPMLVDHRPELRDFADTAALIVQMDLIITIDTAVAHLAGALGKPVWIMLPFSGDWRWLPDRADSPWYPTARLFRQTQPGDWHGVVQRVAEALCGEVPGVSPPDP